MKKTVYACVVGILFVSALLLAIRGLVPFIFLHTAFLVIAPLGYFYPPIFSCVCALAAWCVVFPLLVFCAHLDLLNAACVILVFHGLQFWALIQKRTMERLRAQSGSEVAKKGADVRGISERVANLQRAEAEIKEREYAIVNLYEITKRMSGNLKFDELFSVFGDFLKNNFLFRRCELLVIGWESGLAQLVRTYEVRMDDTASQDVNYNHEKLLKLFIEKNYKESYFSRMSDQYVFDELLVRKADVDTLAVIPLCGENKVVALLVLENIARSDFEKIVIVSMQFALELKKVILYETVERLAVTDSLTELCVRRYFLERLSEEMSRSRIYKLQFGFLMVDIDNFKKCNDTYGHLVGDVVLKDVARIIKESVREIDLVARYGGEEFAVVLPETGREGARFAAERIRKKIEEFVFRAYDEKLTVTISIGFSVYPEDSVDIKALIEKADASLYLAKKSGKNIVREYKK